MSTKQVTIACFDDDIYGALLRDEDYVALGGQSLANAFDDHHVQLARAPSGQYRIIDDMNSDQFGFIDNVNIDVLEGGRWKLSDDQRDDLVAALEEYANTKAA